MTYRILLALTSLILMGCSTPRVVEEHHHHHYEADTAAVHAQVDRQLTSWHEESEAWLHQAFSEQSASWSSHEDEKETVTELITVTTDSLGRSIRQEQRTISRDITRELQQQEQRITREYEQRLRVAVDSLDGVWSQRFDSLAAHHASDIDNQSSSTPVGDTRPWYQRWYENMRAVIIGALIVAIILLTRNLWWPLIKRLMVKG